MRMSCRGQLRVFNKDSVKAYWPRINRRYNTVKAVKACVNPVLKTHKARAISCIGTGTGMVVIGGDNMNVRKFNVWAGGGMAVQYF
jgi:hypothetical protein